MFPVDPILASTLNNPDQLFEQLGSFWKAYLNDVELLRYHQWAKLQLHADVYLRSVEVAAALSIDQVQPFVARQWRLIRLLESDLSADANVIKYGSGKTFGDGTIFGQIDEHSFAWKVPADIADIGLLVDHVIAPRHIYDVATCTFDPDRGELRFAVNPFTTLDVLPVYDASGALIDRQVLLWARNVKEDHNTPYLRYGGVLGVKSESSPDYVAILQACWHMLVGGPSIAELTRGLMASVGLPFCEGGETVEVVQVDDEGLAIVTDLRVYRYHADATPLVAVGDELEPGQALVDTVQVYEFGSGRPRTYDALAGLAAGPDLLNGVGSSVVFPNVDEEWAVQDDGDVRFTLYGDATDVEAFWDAIHAQGVAAGQTLGNLVGVTGPGSEIPVNPLKFVVDNLLGANLIVVVVKPEHFLAFEAGFLVRVKSLLPAGTLLLVQTDVQPLTDELDLTDFPASASVYDAIQAATDVADVSGPGLVYSDFEPHISVT